jgi:hypothetical protein
VSASITSSFGLGAPANNFQDANEKDVLQTNAASKGAKPCQMDDHKVLACFYEGQRGYTVGGEYFKHPIHGKLYFCQGCCCCDHRDDESNVNFNQWPGVAIDINIVRDSESSREENEAGSDDGVMEQQLKK